MAEEMELPSENQEWKLSRRRLLQFTALGGVAGAAGLIGCNKTASSGETPSPAMPKSEAKGATSNHEVLPGQLDSYYGFWSGGQSGEVRILGVPSMRVLKRIPVFNFDCTYGHGITNYTKKLIDGKKTGDTHHFHLSYENGWYDGKYGFVNDKSHARLARIRLDYFEVDAIVDIPNSQGTHGIFPSRHTLKDVYCNAEFSIPIDNNGKTADDVKSYLSLHTCVDAKTMQVKWQVAVDGNLDLCATDYEGKYSMAACYNSEQGLVLADMMAADRDWLAVFNLEAIEAAVAAGKTFTIGTSKVPVVDGRGEKNPFVLKVPIPKSPHGVNVDPTGKYAICSGKLSPTCSVVEIAKFADAFAGKIEPRACVVGEPEVGLGPLHTAFDGRGNAYTSLFLDSAVVKWNIEKAIKGEKAVLDKVDVNYQIGHINGSNSETNHADGKWIVALNKFSKDRFLPVGPFHPENEQLIDISGDKMIIVHDSPAHPEPHDALIVSPTPFKAIKIWDPADAKFDFERKLAAEMGVQLGKESKIIRKGGKLFVFMTSVAPVFGLTEIRAKHGDEVTIVITNMDNVEDLCHGFNLSHHDINFGIAPQETVSVTFKADKRGVYWYYCPWFCHAMHLEMRGRFIVV